MIAETGHFLLALTLAVALYQLIVPLYGAWRGNDVLMALAVPAALMQFVLIAGALAALTWSYVTSDFSVENVWRNSHSAKPMLYKVSGVWGNHEGSMILWVLILAAAGAAVAVFSENLPLSLKARVLAVQASISVAFLVFILWLSNPFNRLDPAPIEGRGLNPILQDPALAFHPPFLYAGYVGLSVTFSFAIAALMEGRVDAAWARWVRPWTLGAWMLLTAGIMMGSWWAYYELGWGGWWFWDPVENASFMPWLIATALLHSAVVAEKRNALKIWTVLLAILAFSLSLTGTFLVRSGVLTSVHAFATDPERGTFILAILCVFIGGALGLFAWRAPQLKAGGVFAPVSREGALVVNNLLLAAATAAVFIGTLYPLALEAVTGQKISVGPPYFNLTFGPIMAPLLLVLPAGPLLSWKRADIWPVLQRLWAAALIAAIAIITIYVLRVRGPWLAPVGIGLGVWLIAGALSDLAGRIALFKASAKVSLSRLKGLPGQAIGTIMAHAGVGVMVIGIVAISTGKIEVVVAMRPGDSAQIAGLNVIFEGETARMGANYRAQTGRFLIKSGDRDVTVLTSDNRVFQPSNQPTTEVGIKPFWSGDLYIAMRDRDAAGTRVVGIYFNPLVMFIWLGAAIMFIGGAVSLMDRRYRIGAPKPARAMHAAPAGRPARS